MCSTRSVRCRQSSTHACSPCRRAPFAACRCVDVRSRRGEITCRAARRRPSAASVRTQDSVRGSADISVAHSHRQSMHLRNDAPQAATHRKSCEGASGHPGYPQRPLENRSVMLRIHSGTIEDICANCGARQKLFHTAQNCARVMLTVINLTGCWLFKTLGQLSTLRRDAC